MVPESLNEDLYFNLDRATLLMRRHVLDAIGLHHVSPEQWDILRLIDLHEGISQQDLSLLTLKDKGNISRIIARMSKSGWIQKLPKESGRGFKIVLSSEGRRIRNQLPAIVSKQVNKLLQPLPKTERGELLYTLKKLRILLGDEDVLSD